MIKINRLSPEKTNFLKELPELDKSIKSLYLIGKLPETRIPTVSIVGTRKPTTYGKEVVYRIAYDLAAKGVVIVSGLALGIDSIAHKAALDARGTTIAILPGGLDTIYPASHRQLAINIVRSGGALLSEYEPGVQAFKNHFIQRNRIVSGIADVVIVIEAASKSGTLHTANFALNQGKTVCAVPGNVTSPSSTGCNQLLRQGATLITSAEDVLQELGIAEQNSASQSRLIFGDTPEEENVLSLLRDGVRDGFELQQKSSLDAAVFNQTLTMLEIKGVIRALGANQWSIQ